MKYSFCVPCLFGLEGPLADELRRLDLEGVRAENGRAFFEGDAAAAAKAYSAYPKPVRIKVFCRAMSRS